jgi:Na+/melibiose symporter-like transporter
LLSLRLEKLFSSFAVTDPLIGYFVSKTNTRWGKLRPWILFSTPFALASYMMIWYVPNISEAWKTVWYLLFYCLFQTFLSVKKT